MTEHQFSGPVTDASAWRPEDLLDKRDWEFNLTNRHLGDLADALDQVNRAGLRLAEINAENFPMPHSSALFAALSAQIRDGRGMSLVHGFPVDDYNREDLEKLYWGFCAHLGTGLTQNSDASLIHYVTEGRLRPNQGSRPVGNPGIVPLHVDLADIVSLLCVRQPEDSPKSKLVSSTRLYNIILEAYPHLLPRLYEGFQWDRQDEQAPEESAVTDYRVPVFSEAAGQLSCRYNIGWILPAAKKLAHRFDDTELEILQLMDRLSEENCFAFPFNPGDIQFANNYTVMHGREGHAGGTSEDETRLLMRIWLNCERFRHYADEGIVRYGVMRHGHLGWTARDLLEGLENKRHVRREDLAPVA